MTPLDQVECVEIGMKPEEVLEIARATKYSRLPVYKSTKENLVGLLSIRNYIKAHLAAPGTVTVWEQMHPAMTIDDSKKVDELFDEMNQARKHMCLVTNGEKKFVGIVTMEDILEQLVGEIYDEADDMPADLSQPGKEAAV
jgi:putative hemolysin